MKIKKIGNGNKRILILHGWMHTLESYKNISKKLVEKLDCEIYLFDTHGFGITDYKRKNLLDLHGEILKKIIIKYDINVVIGHSMGGCLAIRAVENMDSDKAPLTILINPEYNGIFKFIPTAIFPDLFKLTLKTLKLLPIDIACKFIRILSSFSVKNIYSLDNTTLTNVLDVDLNKAFSLHKELTFDKRRIKNNTNFANAYLIYCEFDKIISKKKMMMLINDGMIKNVIYIKNIGHTPVVENEEKLLNILLKILTD